MDPLGQNAVTKAGSESLGEQARSLTADHAGGSLAFVQEGDYLINPPRVRDAGRPRGRSDFNPRSTTCSRGCPAIRTSPGEQSTGRSRPTATTGRSKRVGAIGTDRSTADPRAKGRGESDDAPSSQRRWPTEPTWAATGRLAGNATTAGSPDHRDDRRTRDHDDRGPGDASGDLLESPRLHSPRSNVGLSALRRTDGRLPTAVRCRPPKDRHGETARWSVSVRAAPLSARVSADGCRDVARARSETVAFAYRILAYSTRAGPSRSSHPCARPDTLTAIRARPSVRARQGPLAEPSAQFDAGSSRRPSSRR